MTEKKPPRIMSEEEIKSLARDMIQNKIFCSTQVHKSDQSLMGTIFMPLIFGGLENVDLGQLGMLYEYYDKAMPRAINGYPCFPSCRMVHADQMKPLFEQYNKYKAALES